MKSTESDDSPGVIAFPPLIWLAGAVLSGLVDLIFPSRLMNYALAGSLGMILLLMALALASWAFLTMKAVGTNVNPNKPTLAIVRQGPFRFTRNPMYLSLCVLQVGLGLLLNDWIALSLAIPLALVLHYGVVLREESYLERKFGDQYLALKGEVRRWI